jgi:hypothetical protein
MKRTRRPSYRSSYHSRTDRRNMLGGLALMGAALALLASMPWLFPALAGVVH